MSYNNLTSSDFKLGAETDGKAIIRIYRQSVIYGRDGNAAFQGKDVDTPIAMGRTPIYSGGDEAGRVAAK